jgi:hypothetical protein
MATIVVKNVSVSRQTRSLLHVVENVVKLQGRGTADQLDFRAPFFFLVGDVRLTFVAGQLRDVALIVGVAIC